MLLTLFAVQGVVCVHLQSSWKARSRKHWRKMLRREYKKDRFDEKDCDSWRTELNKAT